MIIGMGINDNDNDVFAARGKSLNSITTSRRLVEGTNHCWVNWGALTHTQ